MFLDTLWAKTCPSLTSGTEYLCTSAGASLDLTGLVAAKSISESFTDLINQWQLCIVFETSCSSDCHVGCSLYKSISLKICATCCCQSFQTLWVKPSNIRNHFRKVKFKCWQWWNGPHIFYDNFLFSQILRTNLFGLRAVNSPIYLQIQCHEQIIHQIRNNLTHAGSNIKFDV